MSVDSLSLLFLLLRLLRLLPLLLLFHPISRFDDKRDSIETAVNEAASRGGVVSDSTAGTLLKWTHNLTFAYFEAHWGWSKSKFLSVSVCVCVCVCVCV